MRATQNILKVLGAMDAQRQAEHYALQLTKTAKVNIGTVYSVLDRLELAGHVTSALEDIDPVQAGRPQRRYYKITDQGQAYLREQMQELQQVFAGGHYA